MTAMARQHYSWIPGFIVRYPLRTDQILARVTVPITIFHGDQDEVISYEESLRRLKPLLKPGDEYLTLPGAGHNGMTDNPLYQQHIHRILGGQ